MIIIIGILAAIAIPMFLGQRDKAKESAVKEGVHSIQVGIQSYAVDDNDAYPGRRRRVNLTHRLAELRRQLAEEPVVRQPAWHDVNAATKGNYTLRDGSTDTFTLTGTARRSRIITVP